MASTRRILVTGGTGYIGGQLAPYLLEKGYRVRVMVRNASRLARYDWARRVEMVYGDVFKPETLTGALGGVSVAYYFIHSLYTGKDFRARDVEAARNFSQAAGEAGIDRIIYLGGPLDPNAEMSEHLRSRLETGDALREGGVPVTEFRTAIIVGSGSASFEMIRHLGERIPPMICPRWVFTRTQPIAIGDVLEYLSSALEVPESTGRIIDIGGKDIVTYADMMLGYAQSRGLRRVIIPVPVLTPGLSSGWVHWTTPVSARIARPLIDGLKNETRARGDDSRTLFPRIEPVGYTEAVSLALHDLDAGEFEKIQRDALARWGGQVPPILHTSEQGLIMERCELEVNASREDLFGVFTSLGGDNGWLHMNWLWRLRGLVDRMLGGIGFRKTAPAPDEMGVGSEVDFFAVDRFEDGRLLRLRARFKMPGRAWLQFEARDGDKGRAKLVVTAFFVPRGLLGFLYWHMLYPIHATVFSGLARKLKVKAEATSNRAGSMAGGG